MANVVKYNNVNWGEDSPIAGERLATNGHYTGEHMGTTMQDAIDDAANSPHYAESATVRYGTLTQDAIDENFPTVAEEEIEEVVEEEEVPEESGEEEEVPAE